MRSEIDHAGIEVLSRASAVTALVFPAAEAVRMEAERTAPVQKAKPHGGDYPGMYRASLYARLSRAGGVKHWRVGSDNKVAWWVESGSHHGKQRPQHILLDACLKAGLKVSDIAK